MPVADWRDRGEDDMLKPLVKFMKALNGNVKPGQIANAFCLGLVMGFMPKTNALWYLLFIFFMFFRFNKGGYLLMTALGSLAAPPLDALFDKVGYAFLTWPKLTPVFAKWIDIPFVGFTRFNNTIVAGSLVCSVAAYIPFFVIFVLLIKVWRRYATPLINNSRIAKALYQTPMIASIIKMAK